jgi:methylmalonyl-CoA mutase
MQNNPLHGEWLTRAQSALKGQQLDPACLQGRIEGPRAFRGDHAPWKVFARLDHDDTAKAKLQAEDDLAHGADGLVLANMAAAAVLADMPLHKMQLRNESGDAGAEAIRAVVLSQPLDPARLAIDFGMQDAALARRVHEDGFASPFMKADGTMFHAEGADHGTELGAVLAEALGRLRLLDFLDDATLCRAVSMKLTATQDMFGTLAKFRAARLLWAKVLKTCKLPDAPLVLHAETSRVMLAGIDAHTNILRAVTAVFGAGLGGADSVCVLPFSFNQGVPNAFARRVARNVQTLLLHESHLWRVADPSAGAGAIEQRTQQICEQAWAVMQACERGNWPSAAPENAKARPVVGVSKHMNPKAVAPEVEA